MPSSQGIAESPAHLSITTWLEAHDIEASVSAEGADLHYEGEGPQGPVKITALSPFRAEIGVVPMCSPSLVRAEVGSYEGAPRAWATDRWPDGGIALYAATERWCSGVLHTKSDPLEQQSDTGEIISTPMHPYVSDFLSQLSGLVRLDWDGRYQRLAKLSDDAATALGKHVDGLGGFLRRTGEMVLWGGGGSAIGSYLAGGGVIPVAVPIAAVVGGIGGMGLGLVRATRAARVRLWPITRMAFEAVDASELFGRAMLSAESSEVWRAGVMLNAIHRDVVPATFKADNRIQAVASEGELHLTIDTFAFNVFGGAEPDSRSELVPNTWAVIRVRLPQSSSFADLGRLLPIDSGELVGWMTEADLADGALENEVLRPLTLWAQQGRSGPYR